jgi:hypothetical protein
MQLACLPGLQYLGFYGVGGDAYCFSMLLLYMQIISRRGLRLTAEQFEESFSMLQQVTDAHDPKQQEALVRSLKVLPKVLMLLPDTVQVKATALKQQLLQQLGVDLVQTQQLIRRHPVVLEYRAEFLVRKATEQGQLLDLEAADVVVQLWTRHRQLMRASTQLLHANLAQLQLLLQPYMAPADVRQLVQSRPNFLASHSPEAVRVRLKVLQECLPDWSPQQLGAALLTYPTVLERSPETIRYKWRIASQYRDMYMLGTGKQQEQQQQQEQPQQSTVLSMFLYLAERYAVLEYVMMQQQQRSHLILKSTGSSVSNSSQGMNSSSDGDSNSRHVPPMMTVLTTRKRLYERLLEERYPCFRQWHKQQQQQQQQAV